MPKQRLQPSKKVWQVWNKIITIYLQAEGNYLTSNLLIKFFAMKRELYLLLSIVLVWTSCSTDADSSNEQDNADNMPVFAMTAIPDANFEQALVDLNIDDELDGFVRTSEIRDVQNIDIENKGITDLTGIQDFTALIGLWVSENEITQLDLRQNENLKFAFASNNALTSIQVAGLAALEKIEIENNAVTSLNIADNLALQELSLANNQLNAIDISALPTVIQLNAFSIEGNPLECIKVNEDQLAGIPTQWTKDPEDVYALDCN
jgi:Leucine-rich repeat (LRR) protein